MSFIYIILLILVVQYKYAAELVLWHNTSIFNLTNVQISKFQNFKIQKLKMYNINNMNSEVTRKTVDPQEILMA